jgi:hypothetical protein
MPRLITPLALCAFSMFLSTTIAQSIPVVFSFDDAASEVHIGLSAPGTTDSDASPVSGTLEAVLNLSSSGGEPTITGIEFTGGAFMNDHPFNFSLSVLGFLTANLEGRDFVGTATTPSPPGPVSSDPLAPLTFHYDAADHLLSFNQGIVEVSGAFNETLDLSSDPVSGMPPVGSLATIQLTRGDVVGNLTEFTATLTQPLEFLDTFNVDAGPISLPVTVDVSGQAIAMANFLLNLPTGGNAGPGDYNSNGTVEQADLDLVLLNWGVAAGDLPPTWTDERPTTGIVDQAELDGVLLHWGNAAATSTIIGGVPEPSALVLLAVGVIGAAAMLGKKGGK